MGRTARDEPQLRTRPHSSHRRSLGGKAVEHSLAVAGVDLTHLGRTSLIETSVPEQRAFGAVLAQNAWNILSEKQFREAAAPYPRRQRQRMRVRRGIALINLRRAHKVVCLSDAMGQWCRDQVDTDVVVAPATLPVDMLDPPTALGATAEVEPFVLVPGTVTWYKAPHLALTVIAQLRLANPAITRLIVAGPDDGSGCLESLKADGAAQGTVVDHINLGRIEMRDSLSKAHTVVLPSSLESLGFSLAESLLYARSVIASATPAHQELASRVGRQPHWLGGEQMSGSALSALATVDRRSVMQQWVNVARALDLPVDDQMGGTQ